MKLVDMLFSTCLLSMILRDTWNENLDTPESTACVRQALDSNISAMWKIESVI